MKRLVLCLQFAAAIALSACNPSAKAEPSDLVGLWSNPAVKVGERTIYVKFASDGTLEHGSFTGAAVAKWRLGDDGVLSLTYSGGLNVSGTCKVTFEGDGLRISPTSCFYSWDEVTNSVTLYKK